ncbi:fibronectin type III domain-containing protein [Microbacterium sp. ASV81]|uniref:Fibronectin type III domain-containing protein n=1 Tax=Microbacterium capsulatum TaxID=3041921 RepID=A0ABU0XCM0_9MICO|nr:fibronectin type III domain-containing protein [Microbacterium sp. ASV81]MDQ4212833.1 fibronectin type III domain-containing protein [Microbacterium sp. ASV81]
MARSNFGDLGDSSRTRRRVVLLAVTALVGVALLPAAAPPAGAADAASRSVPAAATASVVQNGGFESGISLWTAAGTPPGAASTTTVHSGTGSALLGTVSGTEPNGSGSLSQQVTVPTGTSTLSFWYWPATTDALCSGSACQYDWQEAQIRSTTGTVLASVLKSNSNTRAWTQVTFDTSAYAGQNVVLWFDVQQDGSNPPDDTWMYLDDVSLTGTQPTAPAAPTGVTAVGGNTQATVSWTAPSSGGDPITSYTVTPYIGTTAQPSTTVTGAPPVTTATVTGLTNGTAYTFTVKATNSIGTSAESAHSNAVTPSTAPAIAFVQQVTGHGSGSTRAVTPTAAITTGDRMIVEVGIWAAAHPTISSVTDSAGNTYTAVVRFTAADGTEETVWTAPITAGGGTKPTITATGTAGGDIGVAALEYAGLSTGAGAVDVAKTATGTTTGAATESSGATAATTTAGLALGFYADSGFGTTPTPSSGFTGRASITGASDMDLLVEDQTAATGATPNAGAATGANTIWLMATVVFTAAGGTAPTVPAAPSGVTATAGNGLATVSWTAPDSGGSAITGYTVTPYIGTSAQATKTVTGTPPAATATVTGLTNGTAYTFTVKATNAVGTGPASAQSAAVTPTVTAQGQWGALQTWPLVAIHNIQLNNGKYLLFDGWQNPTPTMVWDPTTNTFTTVNAPASIFCSGNTHMSDGRIFIAGGHGTTEIGIPTTSIFDPATGAWSKVADMNMSRWYPTVLLLPDGRHLALSGNSTDANHWADTPEVYDPTTNTWTLLTGVNTSQIHEEEYPFSYVMPSGKVFAMGPSEDVSYVLDVNAKTWTPVGASDVVNGSPVMYRPGKLLYSGGAASVTSVANASALTSVIDLNAATPTWRQTAPMNTARVYHTLTMLADGRVLAVGGEQTSDQTTVTTGILTAEIWDPATETWTLGPSMSAARNYHSTAVLMPDGRVLVAGGGHENDLTNPGQYSAQIYSPGYLFNGPRPTIGSATGSTTYGGTITVNTPDAASISAVNLVSLAADTHQADMGQHFVPLTFTAGSSTLSVTAPGSATTAPPGDYMMFIVNGSGVPSVASMVHIGAAATAPGAPTGVTAVSGSSQATVNWTAPADGGSSITSYTVTPYIGTTAQTPTTITGNPPANTTTITGLTNGTAYTFAVTARNAVGTGPASAASNSVTPGTTAPQFVQSVTAHGGGTATRTVTMSNAITVGDRLIVEVGVWSGANATASAVTDSAGNTYTELQHFIGSEHTEQSVWSAPITAGGGTKPTITVTATGSTDMGIAALEYTGLSTAAGTGAVQASKTATGTAASTTTVTSGATAAATANGLALGFYTDSGFGVTPNPSTGFTTRATIGGAADMDLLVEDQLIATGATANAGATTLAGTVWLMSTIVFKGS